MPRLRAIVLNSLIVTLVGAGVGVGGGCQQPDRRAGLYTEHPGNWGADLVLVHNGSFSDDHVNIRMRTAALSEAGLLAVHLEYPTSGKRNRDIEGLIDEHLAFVLRYADAHPEARVTFVGFSQGGCVELDLLVRLARQRPQLLERASAVLVAPARRVKLGHGTALARRMVRRCMLAEAELEAMIEVDPGGPVERLLSERTALAWSCDDKIVGHTSFDTLQGRIPAERVLYRERLGHVPWMSKEHALQEGEEYAAYGPSVHLATALTRAMAEGREPRDVLETYTDFVEGCG